MSRLPILSIFILSGLITFSVCANVLLAQSSNAPGQNKKPETSPTGIAQSTPTPTIAARGNVRATASPSISPSPSPTVEPQPLTNTMEGPLESLIASQEVGSKFLNPLKYAIRSSIEAGIPANTLVLLLLLPVIATVIAATRHVIGLRGFGIFLPAALSVVFVATGPILGLGLFLLIAMVSVLVRLVLKKIHVRLQYLPRMALILWAVSLAVLVAIFIAPLINYRDITSVSIFPILLLALLAEDFTRVQLGKSFKTAIGLTSETLILALVSYLVLTFQPIQRFVLLNPEITLVGVAVVDFVLGMYVGLRLREIWRFRKLISS